MKFSFCLVALALSLSASASPLSPGRFSRRASSSGFVLQNGKDAIALKLVQPLVYRTCVIYHVISAINSRRSRRARPATRAMTHASMTSSLNASAGNSRSQVAAVVLCKSTGNLLMYCVLTFLQLSRLTPR